MKRAAIIFVVVIAAIGFALFQMQRLAVDTSLSNWYNSAPGYAQALKTQSNTGKPIALFFYTDTCASCKMLKSNVLGTNTISAYLDNFIPVKINPERSVAEQQIAQQYGVLGYPTFLIKKPERISVVRVGVNSHTMPGKFVELVDAALQY